MQIEETDIAPMRTARVAEGRRSSASSRSQMGERAAGARAFKRYRCETASANWANQGPSHTSVLGCSPKKAFIRNTDFGEDILHRQYPKTSVGKHQTRRKMRPNGYGDMSRFERTPRDREEDRATLTIAGLGRPSRTGTPAFRLRVTIDQPRIAPLRLPPGALSMRLMSTSKGRDDGESFPRSDRAMVI